MAKDIINLDDQIDTKINQNEKKFLAEKYND